MVKEVKFDFKVRVEKNQTTSLKSVQIISAFFINKGLFEVVSGSGSVCEKKRGICEWYYKTQKLIKEKKQLKYEECRDCDGSVENACEKYITLEEFREFYNNFLIVKPLDSSFFLLFF